MNFKRLTIQQRLEKFRIITKGDCWEWSRGRDEKGYGNIWFNGKTRRVSRVSYEEYIGPIPEGFYVLHRCDNPPCFNPSHLFLGDASDNATDAVSKGRWGAKIKSHCLRGHIRTNRGPCPECLKAYRRYYYSEHGLAIRQDRRQSYYQNPALAKQKSLDYYYEHHEEIKRKRREKYAACKENKEK